MNTKLKNTLFVLGGITTSILLVAVGIVIALLYMYVKFMNGLNI
jgi:hypothetical protein